MEHLILMARNMVKHSGHARELVLFLVKYLTAEHVQEVIGVLQSLMAKTSPAAAAVETAVEAVEVAATAIEAELPKPDPAPEQTVAASEPSAPVPDPAPAPATAPKPRWKPKT